MLEKTQESLLSGIPRKELLPIDLVAQLGEQCWKLALACSPMRV